MSEEKWALTRIDCYWAMTRVKGGKVAFRKLRFYEKIRYFWQIYKHDAVHPNWKGKP